MKRLQFLLPAFLGLALLAVPALAESIQINGTVDGDLYVAGDRVRVGPEARISGELRYRGSPLPTIRSLARRAMIPRTSLGAAWHL